MSDLFRIRRVVLGGASLACLTLLTTGPAAAESAPSVAVKVSEVVVTARPYVAPSYVVPQADLGPLGSRAILDTPMSVTTVPEDLIANMQARTVNDVLRYLPSVTVRNQQGYEVSRPQSRGFQGSIVQDTRMDGLSLVGTTAIASEGLSGIQVINGASGAQEMVDRLMGLTEQHGPQPDDITVLVVHCTG